MSLRKTATQEAPHATYKAGEWTWLVLKVNAPSATPRARYTTWLVAAQSPATFGGWDLGDTYAVEVLNFGTLESATDEFKAYLAKH